jgi:hypothetical protein
MNIEFKSQVSKLSIQESATMTLEEIIDQVSKFT